MCCNLVLFYDYCLRRVFFLSLSIIWLIAMHIKYSVLIRSEFMINGIIERYGKHIWKKENTCWTDLLISL